MENIVISPIPLTLEPREMIQRVILDKYETTTLEAAQEE